MTWQAVASRAPARAVWQALGTGVVLLVTDPAALDDARARVERELEAIDRACSRFRVDSELTRVNTAGGRAVHVSDTFAQAMELALDAASVTEGAVDPTLGRALELAGYDRDWSLLSAPAGEQAQVTSKIGARSRGEPGSPATVTARARSGWRTVSLDRRRRLLRVPRGIHLDLGATAKAWAADRAALAAADAGDYGALVSLGGDVATAGVAPAGGWRVRVTDDHRAELTAPGQTVAIRGGGLATSSVTVRRWRHDSADMHHIIDPATGTPADTCWRTASVAAADCAQANVAATAALVKSETAPRWLQGLGLPARLVDRAGRVRLIGDWPTPLEARR